MKRRNIGGLRSKILLASALLLSPSMTGSEQDSYDLSSFRESYLGGYPGLTDLRFNEMVDYFGGIDKIHLETREEMYNILERGLANTKANVDAKRTQSAMIPIKLGYEVSRKLGFFDFEMEFVDLGVISQSQNNLRERNSKSQ